MRDPELFKYDVRVRERMLRAGRITGEEITQVLEGLPDLEGAAEVVPLNQPALDAAAVSATRQSGSSVAASEEARLDADDGDRA